MASPPRTSRAPSGGSRSTAIVSDGKLVVQANNEGIPFVIANPDAPISRDIASIAAAVAGTAAVAGRR